MRTLSYTNEYDRPSCGVNFRGAHGVHFGVHFVKRRPLDLSSRLASRGVTFCKRFPIADIPA
jgi:hypothetical protein